MKTSRQRRTSKKMARKSRYLPKPVLPRPLHFLSNDENLANRHFDHRQWYLYKKESLVDDIKFVGWADADFKRQAQSCRVEVQQQTPSKSNIKHPMLWAVLAGTHDRNSPLHLLRGMKELWKIVFDMVMVEWRSSPILTDGVFASLCGRVKFPKPTGINVNMMPIVIGDINRY